MTYRLRELEGAPCPACGGPLAHAALRWTVLPCHACGGVWADQAASKRIESIVDRDLVEVANEAARAAVDSEPPSIEERACPACGELLAHVKHAGVWLDVCRSHGTWFDRDELGRLSRNLDYERKSIDPGASTGDASLAIMLDLLGDDGD